MGRVGVFGDGGLDCFLRDGAGVAEIDEGRECVVTGWAMMRASGRSRNGDGEVVELVLEFENDTFGCLFADAGDAGERGVVTRADSGDESTGVDAAENRDGQLGPDAGDGKEFFEETLLLSFGEAEEGDLVFADVGVDVKRSFSAFAGKSGEGGDADGDVVAYASTLDDGLVRGFGEKTSAEMSNHAWLIVACALLRAVAYIATCVEGLNESGSERSPASLMRSAQAATCVAIKVLAEEDQVFPVRVGSVTRFSAVARPVAILVRKEEIHQSSCNVLSNFDKCVLLAAAGGVFKLEVVPVDQ